MEDGNRLCNERELVEGTRFERGFRLFYFIDNHMWLLLRSGTKDGRLKRRPSRHGRQMRASEGVLDADVEHLVVSPD